MLNHQYLKCEKSKDCKNNATQNYKEDLPIMIPLRQNFSNILYYAMVIVSKIHFTLHKLVKTFAKSLEMQLP